MEANRPPALLGQRLPRGAQGDTGGGRAGAARATSAGEARVAAGGAAARGGLDDPGAPPTAASAAPVGSAAPPRGAASPGAGSSVERGSAAGGCGSRDAAGSTRRAAMSARAATTSAHVAPSTSRTRAPSPAPRVIRPRVAPALRVRRTWTSSAASSGVAARARLVRRVSSRRNTSAPGQPSCAS
ncbi:hypothetical protein [Sorangium sp. So ce1097]|uniref:hypothetical protein n=1 Tax=Sorangium sp. So ce1097 TaxID=3133330 RepID=UPI003F5ED939